ncbi:MAG: recombinase family protein [Chelatococcus sp.]|uniref:recombinase family protein n=1 Tax=Chelatococcus sp. TaxID=1953771 RepID=UPI00261F2A38|nr:recombinase family protein [Chelatococcus sp.]MCO5080004.1 recombinase family protein [Chelatococcus sp.]
MCDAPIILKSLIYMKKIAYIRVSTPEQRHDRQVEGLKAVCDELHVETLSATAAKRPVYDAVFDMLMPGDMLVVWDLDRAFRSVVDALTEAEKLRSRGVHFQIANLNIDTSTPAGIFVYTMLSALAEFERRTLSQRTKEGLKAARKRGARIGRPPVMNECQVRQARDLIEKHGMTKAGAARRMGVQRWTLARSLERERGSLCH